MPIVQTPVGRIQFPDGMSPEDMSWNIQNSFPQLRTPDFKTGKAAFEQPVEVVASGIVPPENETVTALAETAVLSTKPEAKTETEIHGDMGEELSKTGFGIVPGAVQRTITAEKDGTYVIDLDYIAPAIENVDPELMKSAYGENVGGWLTAAQHTAAGLVNGLLSREGLALGIPGAGPAFAKAFAVQMAVQAPVEAVKAAKAYEAGDMDAFKQHVVQAGALTVFTAGAVKSRTPNPIEAAAKASEAIIPKTVEALEQTGKVEPAPVPQEIGVASGASTFKKAVEAFAVHGPAAQSVIIDTAHTVPRLQPWEADKLISSSPEGIGKVPGAGRLLDPRASAFTEADRAIIANAKERGVGDSVAALWAESNKGKDPFPTDAEGMVTMAGGQKGRMSDVIEAEMREPGSQPMTPEQRGWVHDTWTPLLNDLQKMMDEERVGGEKRFRQFIREFVEAEDAIEAGRDPELKGYFPRIAIGKKAVEGKMSKTGGGTVGGKQFFQKKRQYKSEAQGAETTIYEPSLIKRASTLIARVYKAVADNRLANDESLGGRALSEGPPLFQKEGQVFQPAFQGKVFPKETADRLNKFYGESSHDWVRKLASLNDAAKAFQLTLDLSAPLTQGLPMLFSKPVAWAKATGNSLRALFDPLHMQKMLERPEIKEAANELVQLGVSLGRLQDFMAGAEKGKAVTKIPLLGRAVEATGRSFGAFMDLAKIEMWRGIREVVKPEDRQKMGEFVENLAGTSRMETIGISPGRALGERLLFLAPTYYRAGVSLVATAMTGGVSGSAARMALARFGSGLVLTAVAGMVAAGLTWDEIMERLNPAKGKFLKVPVKIGDRTTEVGFGHLLISLARLSGDTIEEATSDRPIGETATKTQEVWKSWLRKHAAPLPGFITDVGTGTDVMGNEIGTLHALVNQFIPITGKQAIEAVNNPNATLAQGAFDASLSFFGINAFPQSVQEMFRQGRNQMAQDKFGKDYEDLTLNQQASVHKEISKDQRFKLPPAAARAREMAFKNDVARQDRLLKALPEPTQKKLQELGLHVTGYEPRISVSGTDLPLTRQQTEKYEALIAEEYKITMARAPWASLEKNRPGVRQERLNQLLTLAKNRARAKFRAQQGKP